MALKPKASTIVADRAKLLAAVGVAIRVVEKRNTIPILSNVRLYASAGGITVQSTNLDAEIRAFCPCEVDDGFDVTVPGHALADMLKKAKGVDIVTITDDGIRPGGDRDYLKAVIGIGGLTVTMDGLPSTDFPNNVLAPRDGENVPTYAITMPGADLFALLDSTKVAISTEETRYYLNGVYLHTLSVDGKSVLSAVATDGHRLAKRDIPMPAGLESTIGKDAKRFGVIVPTLAVTELHRMLKAKGAPATVRLTMNEHRVVAKLGDITLTTKTIDGTFPPYERVIPTGNGRVATFNRDAMGKALALVNSMASERGRAVRFAFEAGKVTLTVVNPDKGRAEQSLPVNYAAEPLEIGFNGRYFADMLANFDGAEICMAMNDSGSPTVFTDPGDPAALMVNMPMRV